MNVLAFGYIFLLTLISVVGMPVLADKKHVHQNTGGNAAFSVAFHLVEAFAVLALWRHADQTATATVLASLIWLSEAYYVVRAIYKIGRTTTVTKQLALREVIIGTTIIMMAFFLAF